MKVSEICSRQVSTCGPETNLASAGAQMWDHDCGILPVVDADQKVIGVVTDRDVCVAVSTKSRPAWEIPIQELITGKTFSCGLEDDPSEALKTMRAQKVRRLPVVDEDGKLQGILSLNDLILAARPSGGKRRNSLTCEDVMVTLQSICAHHNERAQEAEQSRPVETAVS